MTRLLTMAAIGVLALGLSGCAALTQAHPADPTTTTTKPDLGLLPRQADGSLDTQTLVTWAEDGIRIVCDYDPQSDICTVGMRVVQLLATKGQDPRVILSAVLDAEDRYPVIRAHFRWLSDTLAHWIVLLTTPPPAPV